MKSASHRAVHIKVLYNTIFVCVSVCVSVFQVRRGSQRGGGRPAVWLSVWLAHTQSGLRLRAGKMANCFSLSLSLCLSFRLASCLLHSSLSVFLPVSLSVYRTVPPSQHSLQACGYFTPLMILSTWEDFTINLRSNNYPRSLDCDKGYVGSPRRIFWL